MVFHAQKMPDMTENNRARSKTSHFRSGKVYLGKMGRTRSDHILFKVPPTFGKRDLHAMSMVSIDISEDLHSLLVFAWEELCYLSSPGHISQSISHRSEVDRVGICERPEKNRHGSVTIDTDLQNNSLDLSLLICTMERVQSRSDLLNW